MSRLIDDLLDFASIQAGHLAIAKLPHTPHDVVEAALDMFEGAAHERGIELEAHVGANLPLVDCDHDRAVQALANLLSNAVKVTPVGGKVRIGAEAQDGELVFHIEDCGPGIKPEELPRLFEPYWRSQTS